MAGHRICLVTPFDWSQPHDVNEHVAGVGAALRARGHTVTVIDAVLKVTTPRGPAWHRYNGDGYGEHDFGRQCV